MTRFVGKCGLCGGRVTAPTVWLGVTPPEATCESCHAVAETAEPLLKMRRALRPLTLAELRADPYLPQNTSDEQLQAYADRWNLKNAARFS